MTFCRICISSRKELGTSRKFQVGSQKEDQVDRINLTTDFADNADDEQSRKLEFKKSEVGRSPF